MLNHKNLTYPFFFWVFSLSCAFSQDPILLAAQKISQQLQKGAAVAGMVALPALDLGNSENAETTGPLSFAEFMSDYQKSSKEHGSWVFSQQRINTFLQNLFKQLVILSQQQGLQVELNSWDLFHGHLFLISPEDVAIIFHAKEYPNDPEIVWQNGGKGSDSPFSTQTPSYPWRNYLWILSRNRLWVVDAREVSPLFPQFFLPAGSGGNGDDGSFWRLFLKAKTLQESHFYYAGESSSYLSTIYFHPHTKAFFLQK